MRDAVGNVQSAVVLGGGSEIAVATLRKLVAGRCRRVVLAVREPAKVEALADELRGLGATVEVAAFDGSAPDTHAEAIAKMFAGGDVDLVLSAFGVLGNQDDFDDDPAAAAACVQTNFAGQVSALTAVASEMRRQGHGTIVVLSSVAGLRARRSNYVYGSTKAGLDTFAQGLSDALVGTGVRCVVVRPGFVRSRMTEGLDPAPFSTDPATVARVAVDALERPGRDIVSVPRVLGPLFGLLRATPRPLWRRISGDR